MRKELIISIVILILIFGLNYITQGYSKSNIDIIASDLRVIRQDTLQEEPNKEKIMQEVDNVYKKWEDVDDNFAYYLEHNELEKIKTALTSIKSYTEVEEYPESIEQIDKCLYLLEHIYQKEEVTLDNIF